MFLKSDEEYSTFHSTSAILVFINSPLIMDVDDGHLSSGNTFNLFTAKFGWNSEDSPVIVVIMGRFPRQGFSQALH